MGDVLCATYSIYFRDRATRRRLEGCDLTAQRVEGRWTRAYKRKSTADLVWQLPPDAGCCECSPTPWVDELIIEREGASSSGIVWKGVVTSIVEDRARGEMEIRACDPSVWWERRQWFTSDIVLEGVDPVDVWVAVHKQLDGRDPSGLIIRPGEPLGTRTGFTAARYGTVPTSSVMDDVAWTVIAGQLWGPGKTTAGPEPFALLDSSVDWVTPGGRSGPVIAHDGESTATEILVVGADFGSGPLVSVYPPATAGVPANGLHSARVDRQNLTSQSAVDAEAKRIWERNRYGSTFVSSSNASLREGSQLCIADLIPGRRFKVETPDTCRPDLVALVELSQVVTDFKWLVEGGKPAIRETRVATDFGPVDVSNDYLSV